MMLPRHISSSAVLRGSSSSASSASAEKLRNRIVRLAYSPNSVPEAPASALGPAGGAARVAPRGGGVVGEVAIGELGLVRVRAVLLVLDRPVGRRAAADRDDVVEVAAGG